MENKKSVMIILILILLLLGKIEIISLSENGNLPYKTFDIDITEDFGNHHIEIAESFTSNDKGKIDDYIIFFENKLEFNDFTQNEDYITSYPNLIAIRTDHLNFKSEYKDINIQPNVYNKFLLNNMLNFDSDSVYGDHINLRMLWDMGHNGQNITVGVMDNGINSNLTSFANKVVQTEFKGLNSIPPCFNHGTPVAAIIAGNETNNVQIPVGLAKSAKLVDVQFSCRGSSIEGDFLGAFDYILSNNDTIDIINTSFGGFAPSWDPVLKQLESAGIIVVGSAGNSGPNLHTTTTGGPGNSIHAISVGSINSNSQVSTFSSRGPSYYMTFKPDIVAFGENIVTISETGASKSLTGTSFSSPIISGGIATLLSALNNNNRSYNPGLIKAAILESANSISQNELISGNGIPDFYESYNLIMNNSDLVSLRPNTLPISYLKEIPRGHLLKIPVSLISSNPNNVNLQFTGDLSGINIQYQIENLYSQQVLLTIDTNQFSEYSEIHGEIIANVGNYSSSSQIEFSVNENVKGILGVDLYHTYWDQNGANHIGGSNIGKMLQIALEMGYGILEAENNFDQSFLNNIDVLWIPDPLNLFNGLPMFSTEMLFEEQSLKDEEIEMLTNFLQSGKSIMISALGSQYYSSEGSQIVGTNSTGLNSFIGEFDINLVNNPIVFDNIISNSIISNQSHLVNGVNQLTHEGNYLEVGDRSWVLASENGNPTLAYHQSSLSSGKLLVSSTNFWMDNFALINGYNNLENNVQMAANTLFWLFEEQDLVKLTQDIVGNNFLGSFQFSNIDFSEIEFNFYKNNLISSDEISIENSDNIVNISSQIGSEGAFRLTAEVDDQYLGWEVIRDFSAPVWITSNSNPNNTNFSNDTFTILSFEVFDEISAIRPSTLTQTIDGDESYFITNFTNNSRTLQLILNPYLLENERSYILKLQIEDSYGNIGSLNYHFSINLELAISSEQNSNESSDANFLIFDVYGNSLLVLVIFNVYLGIRNGRSKHN